MTYFLKRLEPMLPKTLEATLPENVSDDTAVTSSQWVQQHELALQQVRAASSSAPESVPTSDEDRRLKSENQRYKEVLASTVHTCCEHYKRLCAQTGSCRSLLFVFCRKRLFSSCRRVSTQKRSDGCRSCRSRAKSWHRSQPSQLLECF